MEPSQSLITYRMPALAVPDRLSIQISMFCLCLQSFSGRGNGKKILGEGLKMHAKCFSLGK